jgi:hypothetical protein
MTFSSSWAHCSERTIARARGFFGGFEVPTLIAIDRRRDSVDRGQRHGQLEGREMPRFFGVSPWSSVC